MGAGEAVGGWEDAAQVEAALTVVRPLARGSQRNSRRGSGCTVGGGYLDQGGANMTVTSERMTALLPV